MNTITAITPDLFAWSPAAPPAAPREKRTVTKEIPRSVTDDLETLIVDGTGHVEIETLTAFNQ